MKLFFIFYFLILSFVTPPHSAALESGTALISDCSGCKELQAIDAKFKSGSGKTGAYYDELQFEASKIIRKMPGKDGSLQPEQIQLYAEILRQSVPRDPSRVILDNTFSILKANRKAIEAEVAKLSEKERKQILDAIDTAFDSEKHGNDSGK